MISTTGIRLASWPAVYQWMAPQVRRAKTHPNTTAEITAPSAVAETGEEEGGGDFDRINAEGGPGMALTKYLPKKAS